MNCWTSSIMNNQMWWKLSPHSQRPKVKGHMLYINVLSYIYKYEAWYCTPWWFSTHYYIWLYLYMAVWNKFAQHILNVCPNLLYVPCPGLIHRTLPWNRKSTAHTHTHTHRTQHRTHHTHATQRDTHSYLSRRNRPKLCQSNASVLFMNMDTQRGLLVRTPLLTR